MRGTKTQLERGGQVKADKEYRVTKILTYDVETQEHRSCIFVGNTYSVNVVMLLLLIRPLP